MYKYYLWGISDFDGNKAVIVTRKQDCNNCSVVRIVDYLGDQRLFGSCGGLLEELLKDKEYIDFYFDGFEEKYAREAGMIEFVEGDGNIIPDYFSPYTPRNIDIYVDSSTKEKKCSFFKADGDQDRPNLILADINI